LLAGGCEKGGAQVARSLRGRPGSRFHLIVDASGTPLAVELSPGNRRELGYLLPLVDRVCAQGRKPLEVWADRGYDSRALRDALAQRGIEAKISRRRRAGDPIPQGTPARQLWRGRKRYTKVADQNARQRWPVERTNAWLHNWRRISTRWERRPELYLALLQLACTIIIARQLGWSF
jgi:transposase